MSMGGVSRMKKQYFVPCGLSVVVVMIAVTLQSAAGAGEPASPLMANLPSSSAPKAQDFINSLCNAPCPMPADVSECVSLVAPYAVSVNGSNIRAVRGGVTVVAAQLQDLAKSVIEFNRTDGQDYELGPCIQVIQKAANGAEQQLAELNAAGDGNQDLAKQVNKWNQDMMAEMQKCHYDINDVPRNQVVLKALAAMACLVNAAAGAR